MKDFFVLILGSDDNAYGTARLLHERYGDGCRPLLLCTRPLRATAHSRIFDLRAIEGFDREEVFVPRLSEILRELKKEYGKVLVIPCADYYLYLLVRNYAKFGGMIANSVIGEDLLDEIERKDSFYALCEKYRLDYPKTVVVTKEERETALDRSPLRFPIVVKPENSNATDYLHCSFEGKKKVFFFKNKDEYLVMARAMNRSDYGGKLILQEYIPGDDSAMRTLNCYAGSDGKVRCAVLGQPILEEYAPATLGNYAAILPRRDGEIEGRLSRFLEELGYVGFANFDMKYDGRTGKYMLFEINPRLGRSSFFVHGAGVNFPAMLVEDVVYGRRETVIPMGDEMLWTAVPRCVLRKYVKAPAIREEVDRLYKAKKVERTLFYKPDLSLRRRLVMLRHFYSYIKVYRQYYFEKEMPV